MTDTEKAALEHRIYDRCLVRVGQLESENAKLRDERDRMYKANVEKNGELLRLLDENAKLRELVYGLDHCTTWANEDGKDCWSCPLWHEKDCKAEDIERELGIEVDG